MRPQLIIAELKYAVTGTLHATSADLPGLYVISADRASMPLKIRDAIDRLYQAQKIDIAVKQVDFTSENALIFVVLPASGELDLCA